MKSVVIKTNTLKIKNADGDYTTINSVAEQKTGELLEAIKERAENIIYDMPDEYKTVISEQAQISADNYIAENNAGFATKEELKTAVKSVDNQTPDENGNVSLPHASDSETGIVQLSSAIDSDSEETAATSKAVKIAYDIGTEAAEDVTNITTRVNANNTNESDKRTFTEKGVRYVFANDGYLTAGSDTDMTGTLGVTIYGENKVRVALMYLSNTKGLHYHTTFVKKGMSCVISVLPDNCSVFYYPLS